MQFARRVCPGAGRALALAAGLVCATMPLHAQEKPEPENTQKATIVPPVVLAAAPVQLDRVVVQGNYDNAVGTTEIGRAHV